MYEDRRYPTHFKREHYDIEYLFGYILREKIHNVPQIVRGRYRIGVAGTAVMVHPPRSSKIVAYVWFQPVHLVMIIALPALYA